MSKLIIFLILISAMTFNANAEDKYPLYVGKSAEDKLLQDPVYRHKQHMEQLISIECLVFASSTQWRMDKVGNKRMKNKCSGYIQR